MSTWLAFDAGSPVTSAAVARAGARLAESAGASRSGPSLLQQIADCLRRSGVAATELDGVVVLGGPGSFTGIRVALATALGLRAALAAPVFALSNLAALALHAADPGTGDTLRVLALVDALRDEWFAQEFRFDAGKLAAATAPARLAANALAAPAGARLVLHLDQPAPAPLAALPTLHVPALAAAVAVAASAGRLDGLLDRELTPLYLRGFTPRNVPV